jgi:hypothetical protein
VKHISFSATIDQVLSRTKTVTRRMRWAKLREGQCLLAVNKAMGLKPWTPRIRLGLVRVVSLRVEPLEAITAEDVAAEGFPEWRPADFIDFYAKAFRVPPSVQVRRIEFAYQGDDETWCGFRVERRGKVYEATLGPDVLRALIHPLTHGESFAVETAGGRLLVPAA